MGPSVLANLFYRLSVMVLSKEPGNVVVAIPLHLLYGWIHGRFDTLFKEVAPNQLRNVLPKLVAIANAPLSELDPVEV